MGKKEVSEMEAPEYHDDHSQNGAATVGHWHSGPSGGAFEPQQIIDLIDAEEAARIATDDALSKGIIQNKDDIDAEVLARNTADAAAANAAAVAMEALEEAIKENADAILALQVLIGEESAADLRAHTRKADDNHDHIGYMRVEG